VVAASNANRPAAGIDFQSIQGSTACFVRLREYSVAKLANILFASELARRLQGTGVNAYAVHPGVVASAVWREVPWPIDALVKGFMLTPEQGADTSMYCATPPACESESGLYHDNCTAFQPTAFACDAELAGLLWIESARWVAVP
jgi:retinol dehydrogenase-12